MSEPTELTLTDPERNSVVWIKLRTHLRARLDEQRRMNDNDQTPEKTAGIRGAIREIKNLLAAGESQDE